MALHCKEGGGMKAALIASPPIHSANQLQSAGMQLSERDTQKRPQLVRGRV